jgi:hypothetical protein
MLLRLARSQNYLAISPSRRHVAEQPAMEALPLVMEPESRFYTDPVSDIRPAMHPSSALFLGPNSVLLSYQELSTSMSLG